MTCVNAVVLTCILTKTFSHQTSCVIIVLTVRCVFSLVYIRVAKARLPRLHRAHTIPCTAKLDVQPSSKTTFLFTFQTQIFLEFLSHNYFMINKFFLIPFHSKTKTYLLPYIRNKYFFSPKLKEDSPSVYKSVIKNVFNPGEAKPWRDEGSIISLIHPPSPCFFNNNFSTY